MPVGAGELAQHEAVKPIRLPARGTEPIARGFDLIGMQRQHPHPGLEQPLDQHSVTALDRDDINLEAGQGVAQRDDPLLVVHERLRQQLPAVLISDQHVVLLRGPVDPGVATHSRRLLPLVDTRPCPDQEVPLRVLIDKALQNGGYVLSPLAAPHHRRDGLVFHRPSAKGQAIEALSRRRSRQPPD